MIEKANQVLAMTSQTNFSDGELEIVATELAEAVHDLDTWLRAGGHFPNAWVTTQPNYGQEQQGRKQDVDI